MKVQQILYIFITITAIYFTKLPASSSIALRQASQAPIAAQAALWYPATNSNSALIPAFQQESALQITPEQIHTMMLESPELTPHNESQDQTSHHAPSLVESIGRALVINYATSHILPKVRDFAVKELLFPAYMWWHGKPTAKTLQIDQQPSGKQVSQRSKSKNSAFEKFDQIQERRSARREPVKSSSLQRKNIMLQDEPLQPLTPGLQQPASTQAQSEFIRPEDVEILPPAHEDAIVPSHQAQQSMQQFMPEQELIPIQEAFNHPQISAIDVNAQQEYAPTTNLTHQPLPQQPSVKKPLQPSELEIELEDIASITAPAIHEMHQPLPQRPPVKQPLQPSESPIEIEALEAITPINEAHTPQTPSGKTPTQEPQKEQEQSSAKTNQSSTGEKGSTSRSKQGKFTFGLGLGTGVTGNALYDTLTNNPNDSEPSLDSKQSAKKPDKTPDTTSSWRDYLPSLNWKDYVPSIVSNLLPIAAQQFFSPKNTHPVKAETVTPPSGKTTAQQPSLHDQDSSHTKIPTKITPSHRPSHYERSPEPSHYHESNQASKPINRTVTPTTESPDSRSISSHNYPEQNQRYQEPTWYPAQQDNYYPDIEQRDHTEAMHETEKPSDFFNNFDQGYGEPSSQISNKQLPEAKINMQPIVPIISQDTPEFIQRDLNISTEEQPAFHRIKNRSVKQHISSPAQPTEQIKTTSVFWTTKTIITVTTLAALAIIAAVFLF